MSDVSVIEHNLKRPSWSYEMMEWIAEASPRLKARIAGVLSLLSLLTAGFTETFVRSWLIGKKAHLAPRSVAIERANLKHLHPACVTRSFAC